jgi:hypothetical protein
MFPDGFGQPAGTMTGVWGASLDWNKPARVTPAATAFGLRPPVEAAVSDRALRLCPRKPGLKLSLGDDDSLWREPWWNADRRARPQAEGGASRFLRGASRTPLACGHEDKCVCRRSAILLFFAGGESIRGVS